MSMITIDNVSTYTVPANTVLLYLVSDVLTSKTAAGVTATVDDSAKVLAILGLKSSDLPALVFYSDYDKATKSSKSHASVDGKTVASSKKGYIDYVKTVADRKLDKAQYLADQESRDADLTDIESRLDTAETKLGGIASGAQVNVIENASVTVASGTTVTGTVTNKVTNIDLTSAFAGKVNTEAGKGLSTNDFTTTLKTKLDDLPTNSELTASLGNKVDKVTGSSLVSDSEITKLAAYPAYTALSSDITDRITNALSSVFVYKGSVSASSDLPESGNKVGDVYFVTEASAEYAWDGTSWEELGSIIDLSAYYTSSEVDNLLAGKVDKVTGKGLSTNDYTTEEKNKLAGIAAGAQVNVIESAGIVTASGTEVAGTVSGKKLTVDLSTAFGNKVDKVSGKSLVSDTEITKLAALPSKSELDTALDGKVDKETGKSLLADTEISRLAGIATGAQVNVVEAVAVKVGSTTVDATISNKKATADITSAADARYEGKISVVTAAATQAAAVNTHYIVNAASTITLPAGAVGAKVYITVLSGGSDRIVNAASGEKICGSTNPCAIGLTDEGLTLNNETFTFVYIGGNDGWIIL